MEALESNANLRLLQLHSAGTGRYPELYRTHPHLAICCATARTATPWLRTCSHPCSA